MTTPRMIRALRRIWFRARLPRADARRRALQRRIAEARAAHKPVRHLQSELADLTNAGLRRAG